MIKISPRLELPLDAITQTFGILAVRGAGKSNLAAVMAEEMHRARLPFVVVDPVGSWWGLRSSEDGERPGLEIPIFGGRHGDVPLERTGGQVLADLIVDDRVSCVIDISEFSEGDKTRFLIDFAERLYRRNTEPLHLFLEEADDYAPQRPMREQARLLRAWENVVRRGRARGLGITMITQRSAALNKNVLTQIETLFVLRTTSPQDRKAIEAWVEYHGQKREILESLPHLKAGEAWVWSPQWLGTLKQIQINRRSTFDSAATPKNVKGARPAATLADVDLGKVQKQMAATIERAKQEDPRELKRQVMELQRQLAAKPGPRVESKRVEISVVKPAELARAEKLVARLEAAADRLSSTSIAVGAEAARLASAIASAKQPPPARGAVPAVAAPPARASGGSPVARRGSPSTAGATLPRGGAEQRVLDALAELEDLGVRRPERPQVALLAGYTNLASKGLVNAMGALRTAGLIDYPEAGRVSLTDTGRAQAASWGVPRTVQEVQDRIVSLLGGASARILAPLISSYPKPVAREEVANAAGYGNLASKGFVNAIGRLRSLGFIDYPSSGMIVAKPVLFLEGA